MLPRVLDTNFAEKGRLHPDKLSVKLNLTPLSTATMHLPEGEPSVGLRTWLELYGPYGSLGYFRVSTVKTDPGDGQNISLEHGIATLGDSLTAADTTLTGTAYSIMGTLMGYQSRWNRGSVPNTGSYSVKVDRSNVLSAVLDLLKQMDGYCLTYDFSTWSLGIVAMETGPSCECRMNRNATDVKITIDDSDLCTRVYAVGLTNGYMDADTVGTWGVIAKSLGTSETAAAADVQAYATQYLSEYKNPRTNIEISAQELSAKTGEPLDRFAPGKLCRVVLPDWGYAADERVVTVSYPDILGDPENVQLSLSNAPRDLSHTLAGINTDLYGTSNVVGGGGGGGGGGAGKGKLVEYHTAINRNTDSVEILAWRADQTDADIIEAKSSIEVTADAVELLSADMTGALASITVNANNIELKVSKNGVISSINQTPESITISASKINLSGYVTASQLSAALALIGTSEISDLTVGSHLQCNGGATFVGSIGMTGTLFYKGDMVGKSSKTFLTGATVGLTKTLIGGVWVVTDVDLNKTTGSISYLSY